MLKQQVVYFIILWYYSKNDSWGTQWPPAVSYLVIFRDASPCFSANAELDAFSLKLRITIQKWELYWFIIVFIDLIFVKQKCIIVYFPILKLLLHHQR